MKTAFKQRGMSGSGFLVMMLIIGFIITALIKVLPLYMDSWSVKSVVESSIESGQEGGMSPSAIRKRLNSGFMMNQITVITPSDVKIKRLKGGIISVDARYEARVSFMQNIDVIAKFDKLKYEIKGE